MALNKNIGKIRLCKKVAVAWIKNGLSVSYGWISQM